MGGVREPGDRVDDRPPAARRPPLPGARRDPGLGCVPLRRRGARRGGGVPRRARPGDARAQRRTRPAGALAPRPPGPARRRLRPARVDGLVNRPDPVRARRARIARVARYGQRVGNAALAVAVVSFVVAAGRSFPAPAVDLSVAARGVAIVVLPVPIVLGYGIRAAEREERPRRYP